MWLSIYLCLMYYDITKPPICISLGVFSADVFGFDLDSCTLYTDMLSLRSTVDICCANTHKPKARSHTLYMVVRHAHTFTHTEEEFRALP